MSVITFIFVVMKFMSLISVPIFGRRENQHQDVFNAAIDTGWGCLRIRNFAVTFECVNVIRTQSIRRWKLSMMSCG